MNRDFENENALPFGLVNQMRSVQANRTKRILNRKSHLDISTAKIVAKILEAFALIPQSEREEPSTGIPDDAGWVVSLIMRKLTGAKILSLSVHELADLIRQLSHNIDLRDLERESMSGPQLETLLIVDSFQNASVIATPLLQCIAQNLERVFENLGNDFLMLPETKKPFPLKWKMELARSVRQLRVRKVPVDKIWKRLRSRVETKSPESFMKSVSLIHDKAVRDKGR